MKVFATVGIVAAAMIGTGAQTLSGRWSAVLQDTTITFDLAVAGTAVTGTMILTPRQGGEVTGTIENGTVADGTFSFTVRMGGETAAFVGEFTGDEMRLHSVSKPKSSPLLLRRVQTPSAFPASSVTTPTGWRSAARSAELAEENGRTIFRVDAAPGEGVVWQEQLMLQDGTIEIELRGRDLVGRSLLGVAFRGLDDRSYETVYFRPFNFATADPDRRLRAVQYQSSPKYPWARLREEHPNQYEKPIVPVPDPNGWFRVRIILDGRALSVYINDSPAPTLSVTTLAEPHDGMVGLWVGNGSGGEFANLKVTPAR